MRRVMLASLAISVLALHPAPAFARDHYAAIAYSTYSGAMGWSNDQYSRSEAEEVALQQCGRGCVVTIWFKNACGALATAPNHAYGTGWAGRRGEAEGIALRNCSNRADSCSIRRWTCTTR